MNDDLDTVIRGSLNHHARAEAPDEGLVPRVVALGRRRRATRRAGVAALALAGMGAAAWGVSTLVPRTDLVATAPAPTTPAAVTTPSAPTTPQIQAKDISALPESHFASPTGNIECSLRPAGGDGMPAFAFCGLMNADAGAVPPATAACPAEGLAVVGVRVTADGASRWVCAGDKQTFPYLGSGEYVAWWDHEFGSSVPAPGGPAQTLVVLPYDKALVGGDFRCSMAQDGVTCENTATGHGFHLNRAGATLR